jgi:hypothetical protein
LKIDAAVTSGDDSLVSRLIVKIDSENAKNIAVNGSDESRQNSRQKILFGEQAFQ